MLCHSLEVSCNSICWCWIRCHHNTIHREVIKIIQIHTPGLRAKPFGRGWLFNGHVLKHKNIIAFLIIEKYVGIVVLVVKKCEKKEFFLR